MLIRPLAVIAGLVFASAALSPAARADSGTARAAAGSGTGSIASGLARDFRSAWAITRGRGATVAVLSSGVDPNVQTLAGAVTRGPDYARAGTVRDIDGTVIASLIAGSGPTLASPFGIRGLAPEAHILSVRVYPDTGDPARKQFFSGDRWEKALAAGIRYAATHGADVIFADESSTTDVSLALQSAATYALAKGAVIVSPVGPGAMAGTSVLYAPGYPGAIEVSAVDLNGHHLKKYSAAIGTALVAAPGIQVPTTGPGDQPYLFWGGSAAAAWVAAASALIKANDPHLSPALVARAIAMSARRHPPPGFNASIGFGIIDPAGALAAAATLARLSATARPGPGAVSLTGHFGAGPPGTINAVQHNPLKLAGFSAAILIGIACLVPALPWPARRRRQLSGPANRRRSSPAPRSPTPAG